LIVEPPVAPVTASWFCARLSNRTRREGAMARRGLLNDAERRELFEVPRHEAGLIRHYTG